MGRLEPEAEARDLDGLAVDVDAVEVVPQDVARRTKQRARAAPEGDERLADAAVFGEEVIERRHQKGTAAAGRVEDADVLQLVLVGPPESGFGIRALVGGGVGAQGTEARTLARDLLPFVEEGPERALDHEARHPLRGVEDAVLAALGAGQGAVRGRAAVDLLVEVLEVDDGAFEHAPEHLDAQFFGEVVRREWRQEGERRVGDGELLDAGLRREKTAVVGVDLAGRQTSVYGAEQAKELLPARRDDEAGPGLGDGGGEEVAREQAGVLGEGDEDEAVEDGLRVPQQLAFVRAGIEECGFGTRGIGGEEVGEESAPRIAVEVVEAVGEFALDGDRPLDELFGGGLPGRGQQLLDVQHGEQFPELALVPQVGHLDLVGVALATGAAVEPDRAEVGHDDPAAPGELRHVAEGLFDGGTLVAGAVLAGVEVGVGGLEFDDGQDLLGGRGAAEPSEDGVGGLVAVGLFGGTLSA